MTALLGLRFAVGTSDGRVRTALVALAAGIAIALLLLGALAERSARSSARDVDLQIPAGSASLLWGEIDFTTDSGNVTGAVTRTVGADPALPTGIHALPKPGTMLVSPALREALARGTDAQLAARLPYRVAGTIGDSGLLGPTDLRFIAADAHLSATNLSVGGVTGFRPADEREPLDPVLSLLTAIGVLVLLLPIVIVVLIAGRFGAERRDRRLAALRLAGLSSRGVAAVTAVEALTAAIAGVAVGALVFALGRQAVRGLSIASLSVFPSDVQPPLPLAVLVLVAVPAGVVLAAISGLRRVAVEPLGVTRRTRRAPRRLWWRLIPLIAAVPLLIGARDAVSEDRAGVPGVVAGAALLLIGVIAVLAWAVEAVARALPLPSVPWRFARGRLVHEGGTTGRVVGVVAVALAGAIGLQTLFAGLAGEYAVPGGVESAPISSSTVLHSSQVPGADAERLRRAAAAVGASTVADVSAPIVGTDDFAELLVGSCAALERITALPSCIDGDVFAAAGGAAPKAGTRLALTGGRRWTVPEGAVSVPRGLRADGNTVAGMLLVTDGVLGLDDMESAVVIAQTPASRGAALLSAFTRIDPVVQLVGGPTSIAAHRYDSVRRGLTVGLVLVMLLIGGVLLIAVVDQLRERREALAALAAIGMRRRAMAASILWESGLPVVLGAAVATAAGFALGGILLAVLGRPILIDLPSTALAIATGLAVPMLVTVAGLPAALRLMRPEGLRAE